MAIKLGNRVRDSLTGFTGMVTAITEYEYGCKRLTVEPEDLDENGRPKDAVHFDEQRLEIVKKSRSEVSQDSDARAGGPGEVPPRKAVPLR